VASAGSSSRSGPQACHMPSSVTATETHLSAPADGKDAVRHESEDGGCRRAAPQRRLRLSIAQAAVKGSMHCTWERSMNCPGRCRGDAEGDQQSRAAFSPPTASHRRGGSSSVDHRRGRRRSAGRSPARGSSHRRGFSRMVRSRQRRHRAMTSDGFTFTSSRSRGPACAAPRRNNSRSPRRLVHQGLGERHAVGLGEIECDPALPRFMMLKRDDFS